MSSNEGFVNSVKVSKDRKSHERECILSLTGTSDVLKVFKIALGYVSCNLKNFHEFGDQVLNSITYLCIGH